MSSSDYNNSSTNSRTMYANLNNYTNGYLMDVPVQGKSITGQYIVPTYDAIGYDSLTFPVQHFSGYADINTAYGQGAATCQTSYRTSLCGAASGKSGCSSGANPPQ